MSTIPEIVEENDVCGLFDYKTQRLGYLIILPFVTYLFAIVAGSVNIGTIEEILGIPVMEHTINLPVGWVPAINEELTIRILPALFCIIFLYYVVNMRGENVCYEPKDNAFILGFVGGSTFGLIELYNRVGAPFTLLIWEHPRFTPAILAPVLLHISLGIFNMGTVFYTLGDFQISKRDVIVIASAYVISASIHWVWNTWWLRQNWFWGWWIETFNSLAMTILPKGWVLL